MSPALPLLSGAAVVQALHQAGFESVHTRGSHHKLRSADGRTVIVPLHRERSGSAALDPSAGRLVAEQFLVLLED